MRPLNLDNRPCSPISSNCVIWQGPDIPCIKLCTGDTVSDIIASLGAELCTIMDQLKVSNYDLSCLNLTACPPEDFQALIQLLINKICESNNLSAPEEKVSGCPDCVVSVAPCFVEGNQTTMQLIDYVQMIANRICDILDQIDVINNQITNLDNRVTVLENTPPPTFTLPSINTNCLASYMPIPGTTSAPIDQVLDTLLSNSTNGYCSLIEATGLPVDLSSAVISQCISSTDLSLKSEAEGDSPINTMGTEYFGDWIGSPTTVADAITNLWIALCDIRAGISKTVVEAGTGITVTSSTTGNVTTYTVSTEGGGLIVEEPCACGNALPANADIYAYIDTTSGPYNDADPCYIQNRLVLVQSVKDWYDAYQLANPSYTGNLYVFILTFERYISYPRQIKQGNITGAQFLNLTTAAVDPTAQPPNWGNPITWVAPTELLFIAFVNESNPWYHGSNSPANFTGQPTATYWTADYTDFVDDYNNHWNFFRGVIYPAVGDNTAGNLCLQAFGALNNIASITSADLTPALGSNMSYIGSPTYPLTNPYVTTNQGLWDYNWYGILDKSVIPGPCPTLSFTALEFAEDLNAILGGGGGGGCDCASIVDSWDPVTQTLALRSITSCSLDITVDETGCINIESSGGTELTVEDTTTVNLTYSSGTLVATVQDTGWINLNGFSFMASNPNRPQCRRIGNEIHFRGYAVVPMGTANSGGSGTINSSTDADDYNTLQYGNTFNTVQSSNAPDSCKIVTYNSGVWAPGGVGIGFSFNLGLPVIPAGILGPGQTFDGAYTVGGGTRTIAFRTVRTTNSNDAALHTLGSLSISSTGILFWGGPIFDESYASNVSGWEYSGIGRSLISNPIAGEYVPRFIPTAPSSYNAPNPSPLPAPQSNPYNAEILQEDDTWAFSQNCGRADQMGGFIIRLDGMRTFIDPCATVITTPNPCLPPP